MIITVYGTTPILPADGTKSTPEQKPKMKNYQPPINKERVMNDFDLVFEKELEKLHSFEIYT